MREREVIWLFRSAGEADPWLSTFGAASMDPYCVPILDTRYESRKLAPPQPGNPPLDAVAITSRRALKALHLNDDLLDSFAQDVAALSWYCVGPETRTLSLRQNRKTAPVEPGSAVELARAMLEDGRRSVLHLTGDPHLPDLARTLKAGGAQVLTRILYQTSPRSRLNIVDDIESLPAPDWCVFFSPRGAEIALPLLKSVRIRRAAIGPSTGKAMHRLGFPPDAVAESAHPDSLVEVVKAGCSRPSTSIRSYP